MQKYLVQILALSLVTFLAGGALRTLQADDEVGAPEPEVSANHRYGKTAPAVGADAVPNPIRPRTFNGPLVACQVIGGHGEYRVTDQKEPKLAPSEAIPILMTRDEGQWVPARADQEGASCEWAFADTNGELLGRIHDPREQEMPSSVLPGNKIGRAGDTARYFYLPGRAKPWIFLCDLQPDPNHPETDPGYPPVAIVEKERKDDGRSTVEIVMIEPDADPRSLAFQKHLQKTFAESKSTTVVGQDRKPTNDAEGGGGFGEGKPDASAATDEKAAKDRLRRTLSRFHKELNSQAKLSQTCPNTVDPIDASGGCSQCK